MSLLTLVVVGLVICVVGTLIVAKVAGEMSGDDFNYAPPIKVTSEYEAARIAETTPGAHVQVVRDGVLVSEFFGEA